MCGVPSTFGCCTSAEAPGGSVGKTSSAAAATCPLSSASSSAPSSISSPRAVLTTRTPRLHCAKRSLFSSRSVCGLSETCSETKSARASTSSSDASSTPRSRASGAATNGSCATTSISNACARRATSCPMRPRPTSPRVLLFNSIPPNSFLRHSPARTEAEAAGTLRANANISAKACSATLTALPPGVFSTSTPRRVAASRSMLSTPTPARPTTFSLGAASSSSAVTFVPERSSQPAASASAR